MLGGFHDAEVTAEHTNLATSQLANINAKLGKHFTSVTVDSVKTQVVAGTNYFFHLTTNDGHKISATVFVPLPHTNEAASVTDAHEDHVDAHHHNHWSIIYCDMAMKTLECFALSFTYAKRYFLKYAYFFKEL